jgi:cytochrome c2
MDGILIHANNQHNLERYTEAVLQRLNDVGLTLNRGKCIFASCTLCHQNQKGCLWILKKLQLFIHLKHQKKRCMQLQRLL